MLYMRVHCDSCGGVWEVYPRQREYDAARICPHCEARIAGDTWRGKVLPAYTEARAANLAIAKDHANNHTAAFEIDFISDGKYHNADRSEILNELKDLKATIETAAEKAAERE